MGALESALSNYNGHRDRYPAKHFPITRSVGNHTHSLHFSAVPFCCLPVCPPVYFDWCTKSTILPAC